MPDSLPELSISRAKICFVVHKAREFDAKDVVPERARQTNALRIAGTIAGTHGARPVVLPVLGHADPR